MIGVSHTISPKEGVQSPEPESKPIRAPAWKTWRWRCSETRLELDRAHGRGKLASNRQRHHYRHMVPGLWNISRVAFDEGEA